MSSARATAVDMGGSVVLAEEGFAGMGVGFYEFTVFFMVYIKYIKFKILNIASIYLLTFEYKKKE